MNENNELVSLKDLIVLDWYGEETQDKSKYTFAQVGKGWYSLLNELFAYYLDRFEKVTIVQVKQKAGMLRVTTRPVFDFTKEVENKSLSVCEMCGEEGKQVNTRKGIKTLCDFCKNIIIYSEKDRV